MEQTGDTLEVHFAFRERNLEHLHMKKINTVMCLLSEREESLQRSGAALAVCHIYNNLINKSCLQ